MNFPKRQTLDLKRILKLCRVVQNFDVLDIDGRLGKQVSVNQDGLEQS